MSKVVKGITKIFSGPDDARGAIADAVVSKYATSEMTPERKAEQRAALAASGGRRKEETMRRQKETGTRPLQGSGSQSSFWT